MKKMTVKLIKSPTAKDWQLVKRCALVTVGKKPVTEPAPEWKRLMLWARHSPIRELQFVFEIEDVPYWVAMHLCRHHVGCQPYIRTQRNDRQNGYDRNAARQDAPVAMIWSLNADALITVCRKRLCNLAAAETREVVARMAELAVQAVPELGDGQLEPQCSVCSEMIPCRDRR